MSQYLKQFFEYSHLPEHLQVVSKSFAILAEQIFLTLPDNPERTTALRKLLEAKDCAVRAVIFKSDEVREEESAAQADAQIKEANAEIRTASEIVAGSPYLNQEAQAGAVIDAAEAGGAEAAAEVKAPGHEQVQETTVAAPEPKAHDASRAPDKEGSLYA